MTRKPAPHPSTADLLANMPRNLDDAWMIVFNAAVTREYLEAWFAWHIDNRAQFQHDASSELWRRTFISYSKILGRNMPGFSKAVQVVQDMDPVAQKPILYSFVAAQIETLSSLERFQDLFRKGECFQPAPAVYSFLCTKMEPGREGDLPLPFLFRAMANAHEHTFSFLVRMFHEFRLECDRIPDVKEFDQLARQLISVLHRETTLSRRENAILEIHFGDVGRFFVFTERGGNLRLDTNLPTDEQRASIEERFNQPEFAVESHNLALRALLPHHYGCPAAFVRHEGMTATGFVFQETVAAFRGAVWPTEPPSEPLRHAEATYRKLLIKIAAPS